ncbi:NAD(P)/FAD-dependent oxidoreductase [Rhizobium sp. 16-449-1b]|uniref:NAD(P)-binding domain-containing protein n=1 Tax=Rhizobium sp. 16-449-1b TaxID=2819989 RepID=UPI001ADAD5B4|nr:NAD(P)-binding domain-containing protein [Rhizobium sp. 16-449-1b]MBO9196964.1 NAD(P)/FAD-dependent oxidoreductase [Rhizobium sp. 16-449-1b]
MFDLDLQAVGRLEELKSRVRREMEILSFATKSWVVPTASDMAPMPDVVIIGAGQSGLAAGLELKRRGVTNILLLDASPEGYEGVWETYARNYEIRSPKDITGMEGGIASLAIESYVIARCGQDAWDGMKRVPRTIWMDYLRWFRSCVDLDIRNETRVVDIDYDAEGVTLSFADGTDLRTRQVILATGMDGGGRWQTPDHIQQSLPASVWNHSSDIFDETKLQDKRVAILGAGAAAFDVAVAALDAGAARVDMFLRRKELPMRDVIRELENGGYLVHAERIPDATKWEISRFMSGLSQAPAEHHFHKACAHDNFNIHLGSPWSEVSWDGKEIVIDLPQGKWRCDHIFAATGVRVDMMLRPELNRIHEKAALWRDRFMPPAGDAESPRLNFPYLDGAYRFTEKRPGSAPGLDRVYAFNALASLSMGGLAAVSIGAFRFGARKLADAVTQKLFEEQIDKIVPYLDTLHAPGVTVPENMAAKLAAEAQRLARVELIDA